MPIFALMLYNKYDKEVLRKKLMEETFPRTTLSFYRYVIIENVSEMRDSLYKELDALNVFGRIYVAREGINAQISVPAFNFEKFVNVLYAHPEFSNVDFDDFLSVELMMIGNQIACSMKGHE